jgi:hypothetical protein
MTHQTDPEDAGFVDLAISKKQDPYYFRLSPLPENIAWD